MFGGNRSFHSNFQNGQFIFTTTLVIKCLRKWFWQEISKLRLLRILNLSIASIINRNWYASVILFVRFGHVHVVQTFETIINCVRYIIEINCAQVYIVFFITQGNVTYFSQHKMGFLSIMYSVKYLSWSQCY